MTLELKKFDITKIKLDKPFTTIGRRGPGMCIEAKDVILYLSSNPKNITFSNEKE